MFGVKDLVAREKVWVLPVPSLAYDSERQSRPLLPLSSEF